MASDAGRERKAGIRMTDEKRVTTADRKSAVSAAGRYDRFINLTAKDGKAISCPVHPDRGVQSPREAMYQVYPPAGSPCSVTGCEEVLREVTTAEAAERLAAAQRMREEND